MIRNLFLIASCFGASVLAEQKTYCQRGQACWPTIEEIKNLYNDLDPKADRSISWAGAGTPRVSAVPVGSPDEQPLYGFGKNGLEPLYYDEDFDHSDPCLARADEDRMMCILSVRNNARGGVAKGDPGFVVFALNAKHVQRAVKFAKDHNLCIAVYGTGHDFLDRHSCVDGVFIRTTLVKGIEFNEDDKRWKDGSVTVGAGHVWSEVHEATSKRGLYVSSGWAVTVGVAGWSLGSGHGPNGNAAGLGADNILEVELVDANGDLLTVNADSYPDLFWALRGGVGSTWGIVTKFTIRTHKTPKDGFSFFGVITKGDYCRAGKRKLRKALEAIAAWTLTLDKSWSGITFVTPTYNTTAECNGSWEMLSYYNYQGSIENGKKVASNYALPDGEWQWLHYDTFWDHAKDKALEPIMPWVWLPINENSQGGVQSVLVSREKYADGSFVNQLMNKLSKCPTEQKCARMEMYNAITGNIGAPQEKNVSISPGFRTALTHLVFGSWDEENTEEFYTLGDHSYPNESAMRMAGWRERYWGENYAELKRIKTKYDPENVFWCRHCVGDETDGNEPEPGCGFEGYLARTKNKMARIKSVPSACECEKACEGKDTAIWSYKHKKQLCQCYGDASKLRVKQRRHFTSSQRETPN